MRRWAPLALALVLLAGCGGGTRPQPSPTPTATQTPRPPSDDELLQRALDRRGARERPQGLGVRDVGYRLDQEAVDGRRAELTAHMTYGVAGVAGSFGGDVRLRARRVGGSWRVARTPASRRGRPPWTVDDYVRVSSGHFVVWMPRGLDPTGLTAALADGYTRMRRTLRDGTLRRRYLVVVARDAARAERLTSEIRGLDGLTALTDTEVRLAGPAERVIGVASQRLLVVWPSFTALTPEQQRQTVTHELTHAALAPVSSGRLPAWLAEGVAEYVSGDRRAPQGPTPTLRALSKPGSIGRLQGAEQTEAYNRASAAAHLIAERYGRGDLMRLYLAFNRESLRGKAGPRLVDRALRRTLGISLRRLDRDLG